MIQKFFDQMGVGGPQADAYAAGLVMGQGMPWEMNIATGAVALIVVGLTAAIVVRLAIFLDDWLDRRA